ncbi:MAG: glycerate dehydrogenase [Bacteriovoracaceae bacterium]|jgi:lactate dehydrogenase-like 2-hydroxyacid dehydrogenase
MNIVFLDELTLGDNCNLDGVKKLGQYTGHLTTKYTEIVERSIDADILITNKVRLDREIMAQLPKLKLICEAATGLDNIDLEFADSKKIAVKNVVGYSTDSVAQHTFSMILHLLSRMDYYQNYTSSGEWGKSEIFTHFKSFKEINGKIFGIVGLGRIGKKVAKIAEAFGAKVVYHSTSGKNLDSEYTHLSLKNLLEQSDIISIHAPLNKNTKDLISFDELEYLKDNSILINVGRGGIINETSIVDFIKNSKKEVLFGLDVTSKEPISDTCVLTKILSDPKLFITPHIAWASLEAREILVENICRNIQEFINLDS